MVGLDSVSRLNFKRYMQTVQRQLHGDLQAIAIKGLTKVGVNTFPNLLVLLAGITMDQLGHSQRKTPSDRPTDHLEAVHVTEVRHPVYR